LVGQGLVRCLHHKLRELFNLGQFPVNSLREPPSQPSARPGLLPKAALEKRGSIPSGSKKLIHRWSGLGYDL
jgi:hypothetical protein